MLRTAGKIFLVLYSNECGIFFFFFFLFVVGGLIRANPVQLDHHRVRWMEWDRIRKIVRSVGDEFGRHVILFLKTFSTRDDGCSTKVLRHVPFDFHIDGTFGCMVDECSKDRVDAKFGNIKSRARYQR